MTRPPSVTASHAAAPGTTSNPVVPGPGAPGEPEVNGPRLLKLLRDLAAIGRDPAGGITRPGFSAALVEATAAVAVAAHEAGLIARVDAAGNLLISRIPVPADRPVLLIGSHLDTVVNGGWLDGAYGVVAGLEVLRTLAEHRIGTSGFEVAVVAFANEEGALFPQAFWGSLALAGHLDALPAEPAGYHGQPLRPALAAAGGDLDALPQACWRASQLVCYLEMHIEQGPVLTGDGVAIGVVDAIVGRTLLQAELTGVAGHAGTTPMDRRHDPLPAAAELVLFTAALPSGQHCQVATVGRLEVTPNSANTIAGTVRMTVDLRDTDPGRLDNAERQMHTFTGDLAHRHGLNITCTRLAASRPARMDPGLQNQIAAAAADAGLSHLRLTSGAGHDAQIMATRTPTAMIFVPSVGGVSHVPHENTDDDDLIRGACVLLRTVRRLGAR
jgi:N-carbamoyl-L-amino-acid hydrolase